MIEAEFRERFYAELNGLMQSLDYKVVACAIKKDKHFAQYRSAALDPYMFSLDVLVERFYMELGSERGGGVIVAEKRNPSLDRELESAWADLQVQGTDYVLASNVRQRIRGLHLRDKKDNIPGLQLADLVVSPIGRFVLGKRTHKDFEIVQSKFRRNPAGSYLGWGLVVLPKEHK